jgi:hypothetical protein
MSQPAKIGSFPEFVSAKTPTPIVVRHSSVRTALVQATLHPSVRSIVDLAPMDVRGIAIDMDAIVLAGDDGGRVLDVVPARPVRGVHDALREEALHSLGLTTVTVTSADLLAEPRRSNCELVWNHAGLAVPVGLRVGLLQSLIDEGPLPLGELCRRVRSDRDPVAAVMALACQNLIELDLTSGPIGPTTSVRTRT